MENHESLIERGNALSKAKQIADHLKEKVVPYTLGKGSEEEKSFLFEKHDQLHALLSKYNIEPEEIDIYPQFLEDIYRHVNKNSI